MTTFRRITQLGSLFGAVGFIECLVHSDQDARCIQVAIAPSGKTYIFVNTTRFQCILHVWKNVKSNVSLQVRPGSISALHVAETICRSRVRNA